MINNHKLDFATFIKSDNYNDRPDTDISLIVIHNISLPPGQFGTNFVEDFFTNKLDYKLHPSFNSIKGLKVSSHLYIKRDAAVVQFVPFNKRAWHAGISNYMGKDNCNDFSIGIELEGSNNIEYSEKQYNILNIIIKELTKSYPIKHITGHSNIAKGRKTDPGNAFKWSKLNEFREYIKKV